MTEDTKEVVVGPDRALFFVLKSHESPFSVVGMGGQRFLGPCNKSRLTEAAKGHKTELGYQPPDYLNA